MKKLLLIIGLFVFAPLLSQAASLSVLPSSGTYDVGEEFTADIRLNTEGEDTIAVKAYIDLNNLEVVGEVDTSSSPYGSLLKNEVVDGQIRLEFMDLSNEINGSNILLGQVNIKGISSGDSSMIYNSDDSQVRDIDGLDLPVNRNNAYYTINGTTTSSNIILSIIPASESYDIESEFGASIILDTNGSDVAAVKAYIDLNNLEAIGNVDTSSSPFDTVLKNEVTNGIVMLELMDLDENISGSNINLGTVSLRGMSSGDAAMIYNNDTKVSNPDGMDIIPTKEGAYYNITGSQPSGASLYLSPSSGTFGVGTEFTVDVMINTAGEETDGVDIHYLNYDATRLELLGITNYDSYPVMSVSDFNSTNGTIDIALATEGGTSFSGTEAIAELRFRALEEGNANLSFDFQEGSTRDCNISRYGGIDQDILSSVSGGNYTVQQVNNEKKIRFKLNPEGKRSLSGFTASVEVSASGLDIPEFNCVLDSNGYCTEILDLSEYISDIYDLLIKAPYYLAESRSVDFDGESKTIDVEQDLLAGNLQDSDNTINELDWSIMSRNWFTSNSTADINEDGEVNSLDWHYINKNWNITR